MISRSLFSKLILFAKIVIFSQLVFMVVIWIAHHIMRSTVIRLNDLVPCSIMCF